MKHLMTMIVTTGAVACASSEEAVRVELPVATSAAALEPATTDLGYEVSIERLELGVMDIQFTIEGEMHVAARPGTILHPGHSAGGEVTGELPGRYVLRWTGEVEPSLGLATLLVGDYRGANFTFRATDDDDGLAADDPLRGHAIRITGTVTRDDATRTFDAVLDVERDTAMIGAVFASSVSEASSGTLAFSFLPIDPEEGDTAFDGIDFFALAPDGPIEIRPGSDAHNILRRKVTTHDHYAVHLEP
jgi:hypothetical protein